VSHWLADPPIQSIVIPLSIAGVLSGMLGFGFRKYYGPELASAAIPAGFLASCWATVGWPAFPPVSSNQKIVYVALFGTLIGIMIGALRFDRRLRWFGVAIWPAVIAGWLGLRGLSPETSGGFGWTIFSPAPTDIITLAVLWFAGVAVLAGLRHMQEGSSAPCIALLIAAVGTSMIALLGSSASLAQLSGGLAAATGGFLLWNWPKNRFQFGWAGLFGGAGALFALISAMVLFTNASKLALILISPVFFADRLAVRLPFASRPALAPFVQAAVCLVPVAIAVLVAYFSSGGGSAYG
jgi:hypothetical protein